MQVSSSVKTKTSKNKCVVLKKHPGLMQRGPRKGMLRKGYKYSGEKNRDGSPKIVKVC